MKGIIFFFSFITLAAVCAAQTLPSMANGYHDLRLRGGSMKLCDYCHTPHVPQAGVKTPLWSRAKMSSSGYGSYASPTMDATPTALQAGDVNSSSLCMSCHDGSNIFSSSAMLKPPSGMTSDYEVLGGRYNLHSGVGRYAPGLGHSHPVNFTYDQSLADADGGLHWPMQEVYTGTAAPFTKNKRPPLYDGKMQCGSCHDPHKPNPGGTSPRFLRIPEENGALCIACHKK